MSERKYFGTDGIRGHVGTYPISADFILRLGRAAGAVLARRRAADLRGRLAAWMEANRRAYF